MRKMREGGGVLQGTGARSGILDYARHNFGKVRLPEVEACKGYEFSCDGDGIISLAEWFRELRECGVHICSAYPGAQFLADAGSCPRELEIPTLPEYTANLVVITITTRSDTHEIAFFTPIYQNPEQFIAFVVTLAEFPGFPYVPWPRIQGWEEWKQKLAAIVACPQFPLRDCPQLLVRGEAIQITIRTHRGILQTAPSLLNPWEAGCGFEYRRKGYTAVCKEVKKSWEAHYGTTSFERKPGQIISARAHLNHLAALRVLVAGHGHTPKEAAQILGMYPRPKDYIDVCWEAVTHFDDYYALALYEAPLCTFRRIQNG